MRELIEIESDRAWALRLGRDASGVNSVRLQKTF